VDHSQHSCHAMGCAMLPGTEGPTAGSVISETREPSTVGSGASIAIPATVLYSHLRKVTILLGEAKRVPLELITQVELDAWVLNHIEAIAEELLALLQAYQDAAFLAELGARQTETLRMRLTELRGPR